MAFVLADRVKETTTTTGTGTVTLLGAATGYQTFAAIGNANTTYYTIAGQTGSEWEVGIGTYTSSGTTLSRDTVLASSNSGSLVTFSAGTKDVWCDYPAKRAVVGGDGYIENDATVSVSSTINTGNNAISGGPLTINSGITVTVPSGSVWTVV
jgi:acetyltransferase-like isoleucine patch superfamily enzyme